MDSCLSPKKIRPPRTPEVFTITGNKSNNINAKSSRRQSKEHDAKHSSKIRRRVFGSPVNKKPRIEKLCGLNAITSLSNVFEPAVEELSESAAREAIGKLLTSNDDINDEALRQLPLGESVILEVHIQHSGVREGMQVAKAWSIAHLKRRLVYTRHFEKQPSLGQMLYNGEDSCVRSFVPLDDHILISSLNTEGTLVAKVPNKSSTR